MNINRLKKEFNDLKKNKQLDCKVKISNNDYFKWNIIFKGPSNTNYHNGTFKLIAEFPKNYPYSKPSIKFITKIYHPNISTSGEICIDILKNNWMPTLNMSLIIKSLISLLITPNFNDPLNIDAKILYFKSKSQYDLFVIDYTNKYAKK